MNIDDDGVQKDLMSVPDDMNPDTIKKFSILEDLLEKGFEEDTILQYNLVQILFDGGHIPLSCPLPTKMLAIGY
jgi:hypothetical protein